MRRATLGAAVIISTGLLVACDDPSPPAGTVPIVDAAPTSTTVQEPSTTVPPVTTTEPEPEPTTTTVYDWGPVLCQTERHPRHHEPCPVYAPTVTSGGLRPSTATTAPAQGASGRWAIPDYIVACESGGSWSAENASGAAGPYQLMPEHFGGESAINQSQAAQHAKAAELWNGGKGASHWQACL